MRTKRISTTLTRLAVTVMALLIALPVAAQTVVTGHYVPSYSGGLKTALMPPPGWTLLNGTLVFAATDLRDADGKLVKGVDEFNIIANRTGLIWATERPVVAGARFAAGVVVPFANFAPNVVIIEGQPVEGSLGLGDIALQPVSLGWTKSNVHLQAAYIVFTRTGRFTPGASDNIGKGFWTHMLNAGATWVQPGALPWSVSAFARYELHTKQEGRDLRPGDTFTLEWGVGRRINERFELGVIGFHYAQVTDASGADASDVVRYRITGVGGEAQIRIPPALIKARGVFDVAARNAMQGFGFVFEVVVPLGG